MNVILSVVVSCTVLFYGGHVTSESHRIFMKLYRRPRGQVNDVSVEPTHWKYRPNLQWIGSA